LVEHILLFRWKEEAAQEAMDSAAAGLRGLKGGVPIAALSSATE
jgi:hypothetical protein